MTSAFARAGARGYSFGRAKAPAARRSIGRSAELTRILSLPRRSLEDYDEAFAAAMSAEMVKPGSDFKLKPHQAAMLVESVEAGGLFGMVGVGAGKTTIAPLFGLVMDVAPVVLLVPPAIKLEISTRVLPWLRKHIDFVPPMIVSYSELSTVKGADLLDRIKPKLIVADEVHSVKNRAAARTKRFLRYFDENPDTLLVALSGTITRRSLMDFFHIIKLTHRGWKLPITKQWNEAKDWSLALDPQVPEDQRLRPGSLLELCRPGEEAREGFRRRLMETCGVVGGSVQDVGASLIFRKSAPRVPTVVSDALAKLRKDWETPGGEQITDALDFARKARELAQGFYYVWDWPNGEPDTAWLEARAAWRKAVAAVTKLNRQGLDSELLVRNAVARGGDDLPKALRKDVSKAWADWDAVKDREEPPTRAVWLSDFIVRAALAWAKENEDVGGLIWYDSRAIEEKAREFGALVCAAGSEGNKTLLDLASDNSATTPVVFVSTNAHGTGKNLQRWCRNLILAPWAGGATWEQTIGRTHRPGQEADELEVDVYVHTPELQKALDGALEQARYIQEVTGGAQKMLQGVWLDARG